MPPRPRAIIAGENSRVRLARAVTLTWIMFNCRPMGISATEPNEPKPALLTTTSTVMFWPVNRSKIACDAGGSLRPMGRTNTSTR